MSGEMSAHESGHDHTIDTGRTQLTFEQLGAILPGVARVMLEVSTRFSRCYHAAKAGNERLASFQMNEGVKLLRQCAIIQPRYKDAIDEFTTKTLLPVREAISNNDDEQLEVAWKEMTTTINAWHAEFAHGFLVWKVSPEPPQDIELQP